MTIPQPLHTLLSAVLLLVLLPVGASVGSSVGTNVASSPGSTDEHVDGSAKALALSEALFQEVNDNPEEGDLLRGEAAVSLLAQMQSERFNEVPEHGVFDRGFRH